MIMIKYIESKALTISINISVFDIGVGDFGKIPNKSNKYTLKYKTPKTKAIMRASSLPIIK